MSIPSHVTFIADWHDPVASLARRFQLTYWPPSSSKSNGALGSVELIDLKNRKLFLRRTALDESSGSGDAAKGQIRLPDMVIGSSVIVFGRRLQIVEYGDAGTAAYFSNMSSSRYYLATPSEYENFGAIVSVLSHSVEGVFLSSVSMQVLTRAEALSLGVPVQMVDKFCSDLGSDSGHSSNTNGSDGWLIVELRGEKSALDQLSNQSSGPMAAFKLVGPLMGSNPLTGSQTLTVDAAMRRVKSRTTAVLDNCSCLLVRPHAFQFAGDVLQSVLDSGLEVSAIDTFWPDSSAAREFLAVYEGVTSEHGAQVTHLSSGPVLVLEVRGEEIVKGLRELAGPMDPEFARHLRPKSIRAKSFATSKAMNAVHVTDLPEDGKLECSYWFHLVKKSGENRPVGNSA